MKFLMRRLSVLVILALAAPPLSPPVYAQSGSVCAGINAVVPMGKATQTVSSTATLFTSSAVATATKSAVVVVGFVADGAIRYWDDTSVPTAAVGMPVAAGERFVVCGVQAIRQFLMIRQTGDATVSFSAYGNP